MIALLIQKAELLDNVGSPRVHVIKLSHMPQGNNFIFASQSKMAFMFIHWTIPMCIVLLCA